MDKDCVPHQSLSPGLPFRSMSRIGGASYTRPETVSLMPQALGRTMDTAGEGLDKASNGESAQDAPDSQDVYRLVLSNWMFEAS